MAIESGIRTLFLAESTITALAPMQTVGGVSFPAVFLDGPAEGVKPPFVVITQTGFEPNKRLDGTGGTIVATEMDIDCYASNRPAATTLAKAVSDYFDDYVGAAGGSDTIDAVLYEGHSDDVVFLDDGRDQRHYVRSLQFTVQHH